MNAMQAESSKGRHALFQRNTGLTPEDVSILLYNGLYSLDRSVEDWGHAMGDMKSHRIESRVQGIVADLQFRFPADGHLSVQVFPMDTDDTFGREKLGGVSGWTNWEGTTISLVVYPDAQTLPRLHATVVHEYHHHYRTTLLNNGHDRIPLLESLVREGLAEHFVKELLGDVARGPYATALSQDDAQSLWVEVYRDRIFLEGEDNTGPYQFGGGTSGLPLWAGYSMGYHLVDWYRKTHPKLSVSDLTVLNANCFIPED